MIIAIHSLFLLGEFTKATVFSCTVVPTAGKSVALLLSFNPACSLSYEGLSMAKFLRKYHNCICMLSLEKALYLR
jgi:hypothetical protein